MNLILTNESYSQTEHAKHIFICENEKEDKNVKAGTSATNVNFSCSVCKRHATIDVISGSFKEITQSEKFFPLVQFDVSSSVCARVN